VKKSLQEENEGSPPDAKPSATKPSVDGKGGRANSLVKIVIGAVIILVVLGIIYLITRYNAETFKINNL